MYGMKISLPGACDMILMNDSLQRDGDYVFSLVRHLLAFRDRRPPPGNDYQSYRPPVTTPSQP